MDVGVEWRDGYKTKKKGDEQGACLGTMVHGLGESEWCTWCRERNAWGKHGY